ncbi:transcription factor with AP2 domain(s), putative [Plasmodium chabaudi adami]|uniref:Transcription factor with AP2 domain(S), putative n=1 Tax=Plasmodium chabaudi adami TaxID=5826 RepID=A0A1D3S1E6_PLACE|nr:transcription factor with AP2 domain(s), putative [Plasmodium chabaudi adami]
MKPEDENFDNVGEEAYIHTVSQINVLPNKCIINSSNDGGIKIGVNQKDYDIYISQLKNKNPKELFQAPMDTYAHGIVSGEGDSDDIPTTNSSSSKNDNNNNKNNKDDRDKGDEVNKMDPPLREIKKKVDSKTIDLECYNNVCSSDVEYNDLCNKTTNNIKNNIKLNVDFLIKCNDSNDTTISASTSCTNTKLLRQSSDLNNLNAENYIFSNTDDNKFGSNPSKIKEICNENYIYDKEENIISDSVNKGNIDNASKGSTTVLFSNHSKLNYNYEHTENTKCIIYNNNIDNHKNCKIDKEYNNISKNNFSNNLKKSKNNINTVINNGIINYDLNEQNKNTNNLNKFEINENTYDLLNNTELANKLNKFCSKIQKKKISRNYNFVDPPTDNIINIEHDLNKEKTEVGPKNGIESMLMHIKNINNLSSNDLIQPKDQHLEQTNTNCLNSNNDLSDHDEKKNKKRKRINDNLTLNNINIKKQINSINPYKNYIYNNETVEDPNHQQMIAQKFFNHNEMGKINSEHAVNEQIGLLSSDQINVKSVKNIVKIESDISENYNENAVINNGLSQIVRSPLYQTSRKNNNIEDDGDIYEKESERDNNYVDDCKGIIVEVKNEISASDDARTNDVNGSEPAPSIDNDIPTYPPPSIPNEVYSKRPQRNAARKCINLWSEELKKKSDKMYGLQDKGKNSGVDSKREEKLLKKKEKEKEKKEGAYLNKIDWENNEEGIDDEKDDKQKKKNKKNKKLNKNENITEIEQENEEIPILFNRNMDEREMFKYLDILRHLPSKKGGAQYKLHKAILTEEMVKRAKKFPLVQGVYFDRYQQRWSVNWNEDGKRVAKYFPIKLFGFDYARRLAIYCKNYQKIPEEALIFEQAYRAKHQNNKSKSENRENSKTGEIENNGETSKKNNKRNLKKRNILIKQNSEDETLNSSNLTKKRNLTNHNDKNSDTPFIQSNGKIWENLENIQDISKKIMNNEHGYSSDNNSEARKYNPFFDQNNNLLSDSISGSIRSNSHSEELLSGNILKNLQRHDNIDIFKINKMYSANVNTIKKNDLQNSINGETQLLNLIKNKQLNSGEPNIDLDDNKQMSLFEWGNDANYQANVLGDLDKIEIEKIQKKKKKNISNKVQNELYDLENINLLNGAGKENSSAIQKVNQLASKNNLTTKLNTMNHDIEDERSEEKSNKIKKGVKKNGLNKKNITCTSTGTSSLKSSASCISSASSCYKNLEQLSSNNVYPDFKENHIAHNNNDNLADEKESQVSNKWIGKYEGSNISGNSKTDAIRKESLSSSTGVNENRFIKSEDGRVLNPIGNQNIENGETYRNKIDDIKNINKYKDIINNLGGFQNIDKALNINDSNTVHNSTENMNKENDENGDDINSRIVGVHYDRKQYRWKATWYTSNGRRCAKYYPIKQYGYLEAKKMAIECRKAYNLYKKLKKNPENNTDTNDIEDIDFETTIFPKEYYISLFENDEKKDGYYLDSKKGKKIKAKKESVTTPASSNSLRNNNVNHNNIGHPFPNSNNDYYYYGDNSANSNCNDINSTNTVNSNYCNNILTFLDNAKQKKHCNDALKKIANRKSGEYTNLSEHVDNAGSLHKSNTLLTDFNEYNINKKKIENNIDKIKYFPIDSKTNGNNLFRNIAEINNYNKLRKLNNHNWGYTYDKGSDSICHSTFKNGIDDEEKEENKEGGINENNLNNTTKYPSPSLLSLYYLSENILKFQKGTIKYILQDLRDNCLSNLAYDLQNITFQEYYMAIHYLNRYVNDSTCYDDIFFLLKVLAQNLEIKKIPSLYNEEKQKELLNSLTVITKKLKNNYSYYAHNTFRNTNELDKFSSLIFQ